MRIAGSTGAVQRRTGRPEHVLRETGREQIALPARAPDSLSLVRDEDPTAAMYNSADDSVPARATRYSATARSITRFDRRDGASLIARRVRRGRRSTPRAANRGSGQFFGPHVRRPAVEVGREQEIEAFPSGGGDFPAARRETRSARAALPRVWAEPHPRRRSSRPAASVRTGHPGEPGSCRLGAAASRPATREGPRAAASARRRPVDRGRFRRGGSRASGSWPGSRSLPSRRTGGSSRPNSEGNARSRPGTRCRGSPDRSDRRRTTPGSRRACGVAAGGETTALEAGREQAGVSGRVGGKGLGDATGGDRLELAVKGLAEQALEPFENARAGGSGVKRIACGRPRAPDAASIGEIDRRRPRPRRASRRFPWLPAAVPWWRCRWGFTVRGHRSRSGCKRARGTRESCRYQCASPGESRRRPRSWPRSMLKSRT